MYVRMVFLLWGGKNVGWHRQHTHAQRKLNDGDRTDKVDKWRSVNCNVFFLCIMHECVGSHCEYWETIVKQNPWHGSMWTSWTLSAWRFLITFPIVLIWHYWISTYSPKLRSAFQGEHCQTDGDVRVEFRHWLCLQDHHCTTRSLTDILLWQVSQQMWLLSHSILHMFLYRTCVLLTVNDIY